MIAMTRNRTVEETIEYFRMLSHAFAVEAHRENDDYKRGKAEAYKIAAFELEHNLNPALK